jgi:hypothetical protein
MPNDLRWLNDHAGKRATPYPHELAPATSPTCLDCGADLAGGERGRDGLPRIYCDADCARHHQSRLQFAAAEAGRHERRLGLKVYGD